MAGRENGDSESGSARSGLLLVKLNGKYANVRAEQDVPTYADPDTSSVGLVRQVWLSEMLNVACNLV